MKNMSDSTKLFWSFMGAVSLICGLALLHDGATIYQVLLILAFVVGGAWAFFLLIKRLDSSRPVDTPEQSTQKKSNTRATMFGLLAAGALIVSLQWISAAQPENRNLGIEGVILAVFFGYLSFRAYRQLKTSNSEQPSLWNPKAILIGITIFTVLFIAGNIRRIMTARTNDVWIGVGQMVIWLPIFAYYGYREYRRIRNR